MSDSGPDYGEIDYWEKRYKDEKKVFFEWFQGYSSLSPIIAQHTKAKNDKIVVLGCGNSPLGEDIYKDGYTNVHNIDFSPTVIEWLKDTIKGREGLYYETMDARELTYESESVDLVIDKGTTDAVLCGENYEANVDKICSEISRVLKKGCVYCVITYGDEESRYFSKPKYGWTITHTTLSVPNSKAYHHVYIITKT